MLANYHGLRWRDALSACWAYKTLHNRWKRWAERGVFTRGMERLTVGDTETKIVMVDATYPKTTACHRAYGSEREFQPPDWSDQRRHEYQISCRG